MVGFGVSPQTRQDLFPIPWAVVLGLVEHHPHGDVLSRGFLRESEASSGADFSEGPLYQACWFIPAPEGTTLTKKHRLVLWTKSCPLKEEHVSRHVC